MSEIPVEIENFKNNRYGRKPDLVIQRVPKSTLVFFKSLANEDDFCNDWGMCLKHVMDVYRGIMVTNEDLLLRIQALEEKLDKLQVVPKEQGKEIRLSNGRTIKIGKGEQDGEK